MKALVYEAPEQMTMRTIAAPDPAPGQAVVRIAYSGICGSELSGYLGQNSLRTPPLVFGHELSGWVEALGPGVPATDELPPGTRVTVNPLVTCGVCDFCVTGRQSLCQQRLLLGAHLPGCNAEFVAVPAQALLPLPDSLGLRDAAMTEPAACAVRAVQIGGVDPSSRVLVVGAGPIGLFLVQVLTQHGVKDVYVADLNPARLKLAVGFGATAVAADAGEFSDGVRCLTAGRGVDVAFDAVGSAGTRQNCLASTSPGGHVVLVGLHTDETSLSVNTVIRSEVRLSGVFGYSPANFRTALDWLAKRRIGLTEGVVVAPLEEGPEWYARLVAGDGAAKVLLAPGRTGHESATVTAP